MNCRVVRNAEVPARTMIEAARNTYYKITDYIWRSKLEHGEFDQITAKLERLKYEIDSLTQE